ncbi:MAG: efflux RND transporter permease subunit, partial [Gemmatimonadales bacterium]
PSVDYPTVTVNASLPGASPETMASAVATPLEKQFTTIAGIDNMVSTSALGTTSITVQFTLDRNIDAGAQDVQTAIARTLGVLPPGMLPPSMNKTNPADQPILYIHLNSATMPLSALDEYAETVMAQRISTVSGVAAVNVGGSTKYAARVQVDPRQLASRGIGIDEVASAITAANVNIPSGVLWGQNKALTVQTQGQLFSAAQFADLVVTYRNGAPVRLKDVGRVLDDIQNNKTASWLDTLRSISLSIQKQPGTNTVEVSDAIKALLPVLRAEMPAAVTAGIFYDRAQGIRDSVHDVKTTLGLTLVLVILVIFLFLRNVSATAIPSLALPMSLIGTFAVMYLLNYSLDNLSLMALTLAVGFVVDDAIVMLENIVRHMEMGKPPMKAALDGAAEIGFTIISMTASLTAVFIPLLFMGGIVGRLFREFAVTIATAILVSGFVSLTLTPMLAAHFLNAQRVHGTHNMVFDAFEALYQRVLRFYTRSLRWAMGHRPLVMGFSAATLVATGLLFTQVKKGFFPSEDQGLLRANTEGAQGIGYDAMRDKMLALAAVGAKIPGVQAQSYSVASGYGGTSGTVNTGRITYRLTPRNERKLSADEMVPVISEALRAVPGIAAYVVNSPTINIGGRSSKGQYQYTMTGGNLPDLYKASETMAARMRTINGIVDVTSDLQIANPQASIELDRDAAARFQLTPEQIETALYNAYGSRQVSTIYTPQNEYWVILELLPQFQSDLSALSMLYIRSKTGQLVPLSSVTRVTPTVGPMLVNHTGQLPSVTIAFNTKVGVSLGEATDAVDAAARTVLPAGVTGAFYGAAQVFQDTQKGLITLFVIAIFVIYIVLGILYESFIHPLTILSGIPFAAFGALLALIVTRTELTVYAWVGIIMLIGLVKKNAIMMVDFATEAEKKGKNPFDAIVEACLVRFRPITMTTMAALVGTLPIALGAGAGAESRRPLGIVVVGGLAFSQVVTLYVTPVIYTYFDELKIRFSKGHAVPIVESSGSGAGVLQPGTATASARAAHSPHA